MDREVAHTSGQYRVVYALCRFVVYRMNLAKYSDFCRYDVFVGYVYTTLLYEYNDIFHAATVHFRLATDSINSINSMLNTCSTHATK